MAVIGGVVGFAGAADGGEEAVRLCDRVVGQDAAIGPAADAEAAAAELPLVSTDVGAIREIVRPGETGELVRPRDVEGLAQVLAGLVADGERRRRLGAAAARLAAESHDARRNAARIVQILQDVAGGATTSR